MNFTPIGTIRSCYGEKFGIPRQPGLSEHAWGYFSFAPQFRSTEAVRGLTGFSHIWIIFGFHATAERGWSPTVRPPRLGGNRRLGVFATRSTHRPNALGLSLVKLDRIDFTSAAAPVLHLSGLDLLDGTPVFDLKPYLPQIEALTHAEAGFAGAELVNLEVRVSSEASSCFAALSRRAQEVIRESLSQDPRPPTQRRDSHRVFGARLCGHNVRFRVADTVCELVDLTPDPQAGLAE